MFPTYNRYNLSGYAGYAGYAGRSHTHKQYWEKAVDGSAVLVTDNR